MSYFSNHWICCLNLKKKKNLLPPAKEVWGKVMFFSRQAPQVKWLGRSELDGLHQGRGLHLGRGVCVQRGSVSGGWGVGQTPNEWGKVKLLKVPFSSKDEAPNKLTQLSYLSLLSFDVEERRIVEMHIKNRKNVAELIYQELWFSVENISNIASLAHNITT